MTQSESETYRRRLQALLHRLDRDRAQLKDEALQGVGGEASGGLSDVPLHLADLGTHDYEEEITLRLLKNEEQLIEEINAAVARLDQGTFGICEVCQQQIAKERLQALPYARSCAPCAHKRSGQTTW